MEALINQQKYIKNLEKNAQFPQLASHICSRSLIFCWHQVAPACLLSFHELCAFDDDEDSFSHDLYVDDVLGRDTVGDDHELDFAFQRPVGGIPRFCLQFTPVKVLASTH